MKVARIPRKDPDAKTQKIYAVQYAGGLVKVGQTTQTLTRRKKDLSKVGPITNEREWRMRKDSWIDLMALERECLDRMPMAPCTGREWFNVDFEAACETINEVMRENELP